MLKIWGIDGLLYQSAKQRSNKGNIPVPNDIHILEVLQRGGVSITLDLIAPVTVAAMHSSASTVPAKVSSAFTRYTNVCMMII